MPAGYPGEDMPDSPEATYGKVRPLKPSEIVEAKKESIPDQVFEAFNELIAENWRGSSATFRLSEVHKLVNKKLGGCKLGWLDVEPVYRKQGWKVDYDAPGYNESYPATFTFSKK